MNTIKLAKRIQNLNLNFSVINHGGCGHVALSLHSALLRHGIPSKIRTQSNRNVPVYLNVNQFVAAYLKDPDNGCCRDQPNYHLWVEVEGYQVDSNGRCSASPCREALEPALLSKWLTFNSHWNDFFRSANKPRYGEGLITKLDEAIFDIVHTVILEG